MKITSKIFDKRFVIPDVHGCCKSLISLVNSLKLTKNDVLFFLGDYIDRGKNSSCVLDYIINLKSSGYNIFTIRGNHEQNFLDCSIEYEPNFFYNFAKRRLKSADLLNSDGSIIEKYNNFLLETYYFFELEDFFLVHGGFNFKNDNFLSDVDAMLDLRFWEFDEAITGGKKIIHGHQPTYFDDIMIAIENKNSRIPLDNGCVYNVPHRFYDFTKLGKLTCLNLDTFEIFFQNNIE